jgi:transcriptional regulator with XRE-family HTH domain
VSKEKDHERLGERVRSLRRRRKLSQHELAERAGVGRATIARIEASDEKRLNVTLRTMSSIAEALGVETRDLLD